MANIIGKEDLKNHLNNFKNIQRIDICEKETSKKPMIVCSKDNGEPIALLEAFFETQSKYDHIRYQTYYIRVMVRGPKTTSEAGYEVAGFTFAFEDKKSFAVNGPAPASFLSGVNPSDILSIYSDNGFYKAENQRLRDQIEQLEEQLNEASQSDDESINGEDDQMTKWIGILEKVKDIFPGIGGILGTPQIAAASTDPELQNIIADMQMSDPYFLQKMKVYQNDFHKQAKTGAKNDTAN